VVVHTTPIAVPASATIGEPDIPPWTRSAAWVIHSGPPKWRMVQENHRPSSDSSRAGAPEIHGVPDGIAERQRRRRLHQRFVIIGVWSVGGTEHRDVGDRIGEATHRPRAGLFPTGGEERPVGTRHEPERGQGRREGRQAVRGRDDEALARTLDDETASVTNGDDT
jgi:hypothetical protein